jgi:hypothetical protein
MPEKPRPKAFGGSRRQRGKTEIPASSAQQAGGQTLLPDKSPDQTVRFVRKIAGLYIVQHYPNMIAAGPNPQPDSGANRELWGVPLVYASPSYGVVGEVGQLTINARTQEIVQATPRNEAIARLKKLHEENREAIEAAS